MNNRGVYIYFLFYAAVLTGCSSKTEQKYFSGTIAYKYSYTTDSLNADSLTKMRPGKGFFRYDTTGYQSRFEGADTNTYYYSGDLNKCVAESGTRQNFTCEDYSVATDSVFSIKQYDTDEKILGYDCKIIELQKERSWVKYYINKKLIMAPLTYQRHRSYNWDIYGREAGGGLVLKVEHRFKNFTMHGVAVNINKEEPGFKALEINAETIARVCR